MTRWIGAFPALAIVVTGLAAGILPRDSHAAEPHKLTIKDDHRREPLRVKRGDRVRVLLGSQPGTGFRWNLAPDSTKLLELDQDKPKSGEKVDENGNVLGPGDRPGSPGQVEHRLFHLLVPRQPASAARSGELKFILARPGRNQAGKTFTVPIVVEETG
jgi:predicted secreted protein